MTDETQALAEKQRTAFQALESLLDRILHEPDRPGVLAAASEIGIVDDGEVIVSDDDETSALIDYYYFATRDDDGLTRFDRFAADPPDDLSPLERSLVESLANSRYALLEARAIDKHTGVVTTRDVVFRERPAPVFYATGTHPFRLTHELFALRVFEHDGVWLHTGLELALTIQHKKFFEQPETLYELAKLLNGGSELFDDDTHDEYDRAAIDARVLVRALIGVRTAQHMAEQKGITLTLKKQKRSLARSKRKRRKR